MLKKIQKHKKKSGFIFKVNKIEPINTISKKKLKLGAKVKHWVLAVCCWSDTYKKHWFCPKLSGSNCILVVVLKNCEPELSHIKKNNFMAPFYGWGLTASRLVPLLEGSLFFTTKFLDIPGTNFTDSGRMKGWVNLGATQWFWTRDPWIGNPAP